MGQYYMSKYEYILFFRKGKGVKINNCGTSDILSIPNKKTKGEDGKNLHDTEKPVELMKILIENSTQPNDIVIDPFVGIGSTALACIKSNRRFMCCELDEHYCEIAKERIEECKENTNGS
jgi:site-specific DNA-methyltransferase (adenine-specific)